MYLLLDVVDDYGAQTHSSLWLAHLQTATDWLSSVGGHTLSTGAAESPGAHRLVLVREEEGQEN